MKRKKKMPYVIITLASIFLLIPFAATLTILSTIGWTKAVSRRLDIQILDTGIYRTHSVAGYPARNPDQYSTNPDLQHCCDSGTVYLRCLLSKT